MSSPRAGLSFFSVGMHLAGESSLRPHRGILLILLGPGIRPGVFDERHARFRVARQYPRMTNVIANGSVNGPLSGSFSKPNCGAESKNTTRTQTPPFLVGDSTNCQQLASEHTAGLKKRRCISASAGRNPNGRKQVLWPSINPGGTCRGAPGRMIFFAPAGARIFFARNRVPNPALILSPSIRTNSRPAKSTFSRMRGSRGPVGRF